MNEPRHINPVYLDVDGSDPESMDFTPRPESSPKGSFAQESVVNSPKEDSQEPVPSQIQSDSVDSIITPHSSTPPLPQNPDQLPMPGMNADVEKEPTVPKTSQTKQENPVPLVIAANSTPIQLPKNTDVPPLPAS